VKYASWNPNVSAGLDIKLVFSRENFCEGRTRTCSRHLKSKLSRPDSHPFPQRRAILSSSCGRTRDKFIDTRQASCQLCHVEARLDGTQSRSNQTPGRKRESQYQDETRSMSYLSSYSSLSALFGRSHINMSWEREHALGRANRSRGSTSQDADPTNRTDHANRSSEVYGLDSHDMLSLLLQEKRKPSTTGQGHF